MACPKLVTSTIGYTDAAVPIELWWKWLWSKYNHNIIKNNMKRTYTHDSSPKSTYTQYRSIKPCSDIEILHLDHFYNMTVFRHWNLAFGPLLQYHHIQTLKPCIRSTFTIWPYSDIETLHLDHFYNMTISRHCITSSPLRHLNRERLSLVLQ